MLHERPETLPIHQSQQRWETESLFLLDLPHDTLPARIRLSCWHRILAKQMAGESQCLDICAVPYCPYLLLAWIQLNTLIFWGELWGSATLYSTYLSISNQCLDNAMKMSRPQLQFHFSPLQPHHANMTNSLGNWRAIKTWLMQPCYLSRQSASKLYPKTQVGSPALPREKHHMSI